MNIRLSKRVENLTPSQTFEITIRAKRMKSMGIDVVGFGAGEPDFDTPEHIKQAAISAIKEGFTKYTPTCGIDELRDAIAERYKREWNLHYNRNQVIVTNGAKFSLFNLFQALLDVGDEVIIPVPYWVSYPEMVKIAGGIPVFVDLKEDLEFYLDVEAISSAITPKTKAIILNTPNNPTGAVYARKDLGKIVELAEKFDFFIVYDEPYDHIVFEGRTHICLPALSSEAYKRTFVVNAPSKTYSMTGWRIGYTLGDEAVISAMEKLQSHSTSNPNSIAQMATLAGLKGPQDFVYKMVQEFSERRAYVLAKLNHIPDVYCPIPYGTFYVFPRISSLFGKSYHNFTINSSVDLANYLLEQAKVAVVPGAAFGADHYIRISYAISMEQIKKGMERIAEAICLLSK